MLTQLFLLAVCAFPLVCCRGGVDVSVGITEENLDCLITNYNVTFLISRVYRNKGLVDTNAASTLQLAHSRGLAIDAYIFPCIQTSTYAVTNNITCVTAYQQAKDSVDYLRENGVTINRMYIDIEDESPSKYYDSNTDYNINFIAELVTAIEEMNTEVAIYTTKTYWQNIMNNVEGYSKYKLWYPRYDNVNSMDFFSSFGGWTSVYIKQTGGDSAYCDISQVDTDFMTD